MYAPRPAPARAVGLAQARLALVALGVACAASGALSYAGVPAEARRAIEAEKSRLAPGTRFDPLKVQAAEDDLVYAGRVLYLGIVAASCAVVGLGMFVWVAPLAATVTGFCTYLAMLAFTATASPANFVVALPFKIGLILVMANGVRVAAAFERETKYLEAAAEARRRAARVAPPPPSPDAAAALGDWAEDQDAPPADPDPVGIGWLDPADAAAPPPGQDAVPACERCGLDSPPAADGRCPRCRSQRAPLTFAAEEEFGVVVESHSVGPVMVLFAMLLIVSVVWAWVRLAMHDRLTEQDLVRGLAAAEGAMTLVVLAGLAFVGRVPLPAPTRAVRAATWGWSTVGFSMLVAVNVIYTKVVVDLLGSGAKPTPIPLNETTALLICLQPAVVEELFFRYLALGVLFHATGVHSAVWASSVMFAVVHLHNPFGMPYLLVAGLALGYARVWGGLPLSILLHFLHNVVVIALSGLTTVRG